MVTLKLGFSISLMLTLLLAVPSQGSVKASPLVYGPAIEDLRFKWVAGGDVETAMVRGDIDVITQIWWEPTFERLKDYGFATTVAQRFNMYCMVFNMRNEPFTNPNLRKALAHVVPKDQIISELFGIVTNKLDTYMPSSLIGWFNPYVQTYEYDLTKAEKILDDAGYVYNATAGRRMDPATGQPLRDLNFVSITWILYPPLDYLTMMIVDNLWAVGIPAYITWLTGPDFYQRIVSDRNFDFCVLGYGLDRNPRYLYYLFHSSQDFPGGQNTAGINNTELDNLLDILHSNLNRREVRDASHEAQEKLSMLLPYVPIYSENDLSAFGRSTPEGIKYLKGIINSLGYGIKNPWTFWNVHWDEMPVGGNLTWRIMERPDSLNPLYASHSWEWDILNQVYDPLIAVNPYTHNDVPLLAYNWSVEPWVAPGDVSGMNITFLIRDDVYWHDDTQFTAEDIKFSWEYIQQHNISNCHIDKQVWENLVDVTVMNPYTVSAYYNTTSSWIIYALSDTAAILPKHIWQDIQDPALFEPWREPHSSPPSDRPWLTKLLGTGPYVFEVYNEANLYVDLHANRRYFLSQDEIQGLIVEMFHAIGDVGSTPLSPWNVPDGKIDIWDMTYLAYNFGYLSSETPSDPDDRTQAGYRDYLDINDDGIIDLSDISMVAYHLGEAREVP